jgi:tRNA A-37 threonylcarbamoyl transferase component Bud32
MDAAENDVVSNGPISLVQVTAGGVRWQLRPEHRDRLVGPEGLRLAEWLRTGQARVIKHGPHRTVYQVTLPGLSFFLKHFRLTDVRAWLRQVVRPAKARMEFDRALAVAARQVPTITPLGLGVGCAAPGPNESFLLTRGLENVEPLNLFIEQTLPKLSAGKLARVRLRLAERLGALMAHMHDAGIVHNDLHAANLLIQLDNDDQPHLYLIDLHAVHLGLPGWPRSRANLVMLNRWFVLRAGRADRLRFWLSYCRTRSKWPHGQSAPNSQSAETGSLSGPHYPPPALYRRWLDLARDLEKRTWASNLRFWRHRDRRCLVTNRYYERVRGSMAAGYAVRDLDRAALTALLADPDEPFRQPGVRLLKNSPSSTVAEFEMTVGGVVRPIIYKRFRVTAWTDPLVSLVRSSAGLRSWINGHSLRERCLLTARPLAVLQRRKHGLSYEGYLLTEKIVDAIDLRQFLLELASRPASVRPVILRGLIDQVARVIGALHERHVSHRDLKSANILIATPSHSLRPTRHEIWLIDLVGVRRHRKLGRSRRVQNLARLHASFYQNQAVTRTDKLRFLRIYLHWGLRGSGGWKRWWQQIEQATLAKVARNLRNRRPLA